MNEGVAAMKDLFKLGGKVAKKHQKERPPERTLPSGTKLVPVELEPGIWGFRKKWAKK